MVRERYAMFALIPVFILYSFLNYSVQSRLIILISKLLLSIIANAYLKSIVLRFEGPNVPIFNLYPKKMIGWQNLIALVVPFFVFFNKR